MAQYGSADVICLSPDGDGPLLGTSQRVRHVDHHEVTGVVTSIRVPLKGAGVTLVCVEPDDVGAMRRRCCSWPTEGGGDYVQWRDSGAPAWKWETVR